MGVSYSISRRNLLLIQMTIAMRGLESLEEKVHLRAFFLSPFRTRSNFVPKGCPYSISFLPNIIQIMMTFYRGLLCSTDYFRGHIAKSEHNPSVQQAIKVKNTLLLPNLIRLCFSVQTMRSKLKPPSRASITPEKHDAENALEANNAKATGSIIRKK
jgi:hypothetical protein